MYNQLTILKIKRCSVEASSLQYSPDTTKYAIVDASGVTIYSTATRTIFLHIALSSLTAIAFSPQGTFLLTHRRPAKAADGTSERNLALYNLAQAAAAGQSQEPVLSLHQKSFDKDHWPTVQFTSDETLAAHMVTNTVHIYNPADFSSGPIAKLHVKGITAYSLSPNSANPVVAAYVPEVKGSPAFIAIYPCPFKSSGGADDKGTPAPICRRSFYRCNAVRFMWNVGGEAVLALTAADVDATNQSYYGEQKLFYFAADGSNEQQVQLPKDGPVHDVQWSPKGDYFIALAGFMPAKATLFTSKCIPKFDLGSGPYSMVRWNPFGRFFCLAGFGNLPGDVAFYDKKADGKCKSMGMTRAENGVTLEWSPCGRFLLTATIAPRLRVDNGVQVFKYDGTLVARVKHDVLLEAKWQPAAAGSFEDKPQSPRAAGIGGASKGGSNTNGSNAALPPQPTRAAGYVPPHLRNNPAAAAAAKASFSLAQDANDKGGKIKVSASGGAGGSSRASSKAASSVPGLGGDALPPGAASEASKTASRNAKRRAAKKKAEGAAEGVANLKL